MEKISLGPYVVNWRSSERTSPRTMAKRCLSDHESVHGHAAGTGEGIAEAAERLFDDCYHDPPRYHDVPRHLHRMS